MEIETFKMGGGCKIVLAFTKKDHAKIRSIIDKNEATIQSPWVQRHACQPKEMQGSSDNSFFRAEQERLTGEITTGWIRCHHTSFLYLKRNHNNKLKRSEKRKHKFTMTGDRTWGYPAFVSTSCICTLADRGPVVVVLWAVVEEVSGGTACPLLIPRHAVLPDGGMAGAEHAGELSHLAWKDQQCIWLG